MEFKKTSIINLNDSVKVKLTEEGMQELARQHSKLRKHLINIGANDIGEFILKLDDKGFYHTQLWNLMKKFEKYFDLGEPEVIEEGNIYIETVANLRGGLNG